MTLSALLVCVDEAPAQVLRRVLEELSIRVETCPDFVRAAIRLAQERFDVVIVDGESNQEVISLLRETRLSRLNDATLAVAVVAGQENIRELFSLGVNFVLYKPVAYDRALSSLRAARAVMRKEKRKSARATVHAHATVDYANVEQEKATLVDLAQDGMAVQFGKKLPPISKVYFQFQLPGQAANVRLSGQVIWQDWNGPRRSSVRGRAQGLAPPADGFSGRQLMPAEHPGAERFPGRHGGDGRAAATGHSIGRRANPWQPEHARRGTPRRWLRNRAATAHRRCR